MHSFAVSVVARFFLSGVNLCVTVQQVKRVTIAEAIMGIEACRDAILTDCHHQALSVSCSLTTTPSIKTPSFCSELIQLQGS
jgi:hypothetical protein